MGAEIKQARRENQHIRLSTDLSFEKRFRDEKEPGRNEENKRLCVRKWGGNQPYYNCAR